jgi:hypothetical protein
MDMGLNLQTSTDTGSVCVGICSGEDVVLESFEADVYLAKGSFWLED